MNPEVKMVLQDLLALNLELQGIVRNVVEGKTPESIYRRMIELDTHTRQTIHRIANL